MKISIRPSGIFHVSEVKNKIEESFLEAIENGGMPQALFFIDTQPTLTQTHPDLIYWLDFVRLFLREFCSIQDLELKIKNALQLKTEAPHFDEIDVSRLLSTKPLTQGCENITYELLQNLWRHLHEFLINDIIQSGQALEEYFHSRHQGVALQGRVWFHLAENKSGNEKTPFAFLATYSNKISSSGKLSQSILEVLTHRKNGLLPQENEIQFNCSCPDWADMCKHVAAVMYGIGSRLDSEPELLFVLCNVDQTKLLNAKSSILSTSAKSKIANKITDQSLEDIFGIEIDNNSHTTHKKKDLTRPKLSKVTMKRKTKAKSKAKAKAKTRAAKK